MHAKESLSFSPKPLNQPLDAYIPKIHHLHSQTLLIQLLILKNQKLTDGRAKKNEAKHIDHKEHQKIDIGNGPVG